VTDVDWFTSHHTDIIATAQLKDISHYGSDHAEIVATPRSGNTLCFYVNAQAKRRLVENAYFSKDCFTSA
jgi:hypothetical protein